MPSNIVVCLLEVVNWSHESYRISYLHKNSTNTGGQCSFLRRKPSRGHFSSCIQEKWISYSSQNLASQDPVKWRVDNDYQTKPQSSSRQEHPHNNLLKNQAYWKFNAPVVNYPHCREIKRDVENDEDFHRKPYNIFAGVVDLYF